MLKQLSEQNDLWISYAFKITGCKIKAQDLVQDMYVKLHDYNKPINKGFVYRVLRNMFLDEKKKRKVSLEFVEEIKDYFINYTECDKLDTRIEALDLIEHLDWFDREVLLQSFEMSLRQKEKETDVPYYVWNYYRKKILNELQIKYVKE